MPELPDVEAYKIYFDKKALHKKITKVEVLDGSILKTSANKLQENLTNHEFKSSRRIGKNLLVQIAKDNWLILHFGMTGYLNYYKEDGEIPKFSKILFHLNNDHCLSFINKRKLGYADLTYDLEKWRKKKQLGPDALDVSLPEYINIIKKKKSVIKAALTDQKVIAGIGNIYADEILFQSNIHPETKIKDLTKNQLKNIYQTMNRIFATSINHNAQPDDLPSNYLLHYRNEGDECPKCGGKINKITLSGRSTYYCPSCQKK